MENKNKPAKDLTKGELISALAMQGLLANPANTDYEEIEICEASLLFSDGLLKQFEATKRKWWEVLECEELSPEDHIIKQHKMLLKKYAPGNRKTGNSEKFLEVMEAWKQAKEAIY